MKRTLSLLVAVFLLLSVTTSADTSTFSAVPESPTAEVLELELLGTENTPRGVIKTFNLNVPADGAYHYFPEFEDIYQPGTTVSFFGVWEPSYTQLAVRLDAIATGGGQIFHITSRSQSERTLYVDSLYTMQLKAIGSAISGTMQITINPPESVSAVPIIDYFGSSSNNKLLSSVSRFKTHSTEQNKSSVTFRSGANWGSSSESKQHILISARDLFGFDLSNLKYVSFGELWSNNFNPELSPLKSIMTEIYASLKEGDQLPFGILYSTETAYTIHSLACGSTVLIEYTLQPEPTYNPNTGDFFQLDYAVLKMLFSSDAEAATQQIESLLKSEEKIQYYAYLDMTTADKSLHPLILEARRTIIYRYSWVADEIDGWVKDKKGNIIETLPHFSDLFPDDWKIPVESVEVDLSYYGR